MENVCCHLKLYVPITVIHWESDGNRKPDANIHTILLQQGRELHLIEQCLLKYCSLFVASLVLHFQLDRAFVITI